MWNKFPPRMRRTITAALDEAGRRGCEAAGAEDLVLAVCANTLSGGAITFRRCGLKLADVSARVGEIAPRNGSPRPRVEALAPSAMELLERATTEAMRLGHDHVGTEHIAVALPQLDTLPVGRKLRELGLTAPAAEAAARSWVAEGMPRGDGQFASGGRAAFVRGKLKKLLRLPGLAWNVFVRKSLGHPGFVTNPYPLYGWLRNHEPVRKDPLAPIWILTRYEDVASLLRESRFRKDPFAAERLPRQVREQLGVEQDRVDADYVSMLFLDPPQHTRVRAAFARWFTPASLAALRPRIEMICAKRLDRVHASGRMELIGDLAYPLPMIVIAEMLGFPAEDYPKFKKWSDEMTASLSLNATAEQHTIAADARGQLREYFDQVVVPMKNRRGDSIISRLMETEDVPGGLGREEIFTNVVLLLAAGHETTTNLIGNGILALMRNGDQWEQLVKEPSLVESAVEEMLRYDSPVQWASRAAPDALELNGQKIGEGEIILGCLGAANRDPARFAEPDRFDIRRADNKHLSFGAGAHYCIGATLARMEAQIVLSALIERYARMKWPGGKLMWTKGLTFRGLRRLPLTWR